jgi:hypothetical protein
VRVREESLGGYTRGLGTSLRAVCYRCVVALRHLSEIKETLVDSRCFLEHLAYSAMGLGLTVRYSAVPGGAEHLTLRPRHSHVL